MTESDKSWHELFDAGVSELREGLAGITDEKLAQMNPAERRFVLLSRANLKRYDEAVARREKRCTRDESATSK